MDLYLSQDVAFEWLVIISIISGIVCGIFYGINEGSILAGIGAVFLGFFLFLVGGLGGIVILNLTYVIAIITVIDIVIGIVNPNAAANSLPFGWFFVSIGCAISVFTGIITFRNQEENDKYKILKTLLIIPLSYAAFIIIAIIVAWVTKTVANSMPIAWLFISTGCAISVFAGIITFRNQEENDKYKILKTLLIIPLPYVAFGIISIIVAWVTKVVANSLSFGWFFISTVCAISVFMGIKEFRDVSGIKDKALSLLLPPLSYIAFMIIVIIIDMTTESVTRSLSPGWLFVSIGCAISVFMGIKTIRNHKIDGKYNALIKALFIIPLSYIAFMIIMIIIS